MYSFTFNMKRFVIFYSSVSSQAVDSFSRDPGEVIIAGEGSFLNLLIQILFNCSLEVTTSDNF